MGERITWAGRVAGVTVGACLAISGLALMVSAWDELTCHDAAVCEDTAALAGLTSILAIALTTAGCLIVIRVWRRPVHPDGTSGWIWGLGISFACAAIAAALLIPAGTCPSGGTFDPILHQCLEGHTRLPAAVWGWAKWLTALTGIAVGFGIGLATRRWNRLVTLAALLTVLGWGAAVAWILLASFAGGLESMAARLAA
jgi:hypothetical protein